MPTGVTLLHSCCFLLLFGDSLCFTLPSVYLRSICFPSFCPSSLPFIVTDIANNRGIYFTSNSKELTRYTITWKKRYLPVPSYILVCYKEHEQYVWTVIGETNVILFSRWIHRSTRWPRTRNWILYGCTENTEYFSLFFHRALLASSFAKNYFADTLFSLRTIIAPLPHFVFLSPSSLAQPPLVRGPIIVISLSGIPESEELNLGRLLSSNEKVELVFPWFSCRKPRTWQASNFSVLRTMSVNEQAYEMIHAYAYPRGKQKGTEKRKSESPCDRAPRVCICARK